MNQKTNEASSTKSDKSDTFKELVDQAKEEQESRLKSPSELISELKQPAAPAPVSVKKKKKTPAQKRKETREKAKQTRERKKAEAEKEEEELKPFELINKDVLKVFAGLIPFGILAMILNNNKYLCTDQEKDILAVQWDNLIRARVPDVISQYGPEYTLGLTISLFLIEKSEIFKQGSVKKEFESKKIKIKGYE